MAGANVFKIPVLKITVGNNTLLISRDAKQEIYPTSKEALTRNLNSELVQTHSKIKLKTIIETKDDVDVNALRQSMEKKEVCKVFSMVRFLSSRSSTLENYVEDSLEQDGDVITYRPILDMVLTNFTCKATNDGDQIWKLELEEL